MFSKVKHKLFFSYLLFSSFFILSTIASLWLYKEKDRISGILKTLDEINILALKDFKVQQEFLTYETINPQFFKTGKSSKINEHNVITAEILWKLKLLTYQNEAEKFQIPYFVNSIESEFSNQKNTFNKVVIQLLKRGFKDYGIEGEMRVYVHALMNIKELNQVNILMLRRHEKDFILRKENQYVVKFRNLIEDVRNEAYMNPKISPERKAGINFIVNSYAQSFAKLVAAEKVLGIQGQSGLMLRLANYNNSIESIIAAQKKVAAAAEAKFFKRLLITASVIMGCISVFSLLLSYWVAVALTKPVVSLSKYIEEYVKSNFTRLPEFKARTSKDEVSVLMNNFFRMAAEIENYINSFREKVEERTAEINKQNKEILQQKKMIIEQRDELAVKTDILEMQQKLVTEKNKNILDSIRYAERIQQAILPPDEVIRQTLPNSFVYFQPKDIVSGDFYWIDEVDERVRAKNILQIYEPEDDYTEAAEAYEFSKKVLFAAVDCTGHGVPGAFMSIVGHNSLNKIVLEQKLTKPDAILNALNREVKRTLRQQKKETAVKDGMDIALCCLDYETRILQFAGANNPLYLIKKGELVEIKGSKHPIGVHMENKQPDFFNHEIQLEEGDTIYVFSDGYLDQFGGPESKKFKRSQFQKLLLSIQDKDMEEQKIILRKRLEEWRGPNFRLTTFLI